MSDKPKINDRVEVQAFWTAKPNRTQQGTYTNDQMGRPVVRLESGTSVVLPNASFMRKLVDKNTA